MTAKRTVVIWDRLGEYHHARLSEASRQLPLAAIEVFKRDNTYAWGFARAREGYSVKTLAEDPKLTNIELRERMARALTTLNAQIVAVPGWSEPYSLFAIEWAHQNNARVVIMSDSNWFDAPRNALAERAKRAVVAHSGAGLTAGRHSQAYLERLGLNKTRIELGYDVVDNQHFSRPENKPRPGELGAQRFLAVARFISRKNLDGLINAYERYRSLVVNDEAAWPLMLVGDGVEREVLKGLVASAGLNDKVIFTGFREYNEMPELYHASGALILPSHVEQWGLVVNEAMAAGLPVLVSKNAGAAGDLVHKGENGACFAPKDFNGLAKLMTQLSSSNSFAAQMGAASAQIIENWGLQRFATGLKNAARIAEKAPARVSYADRLIFKSLLAKSTR
ncbi:MULTISPECIES: glycosyltransferase family 4 protein [unclassified Thioclava]|uniref:glycosyltransferase family 4 protein n=1 Tax=unclassified Thioclava TaxID=2621713 RepID=UPI00099771A7|nr:MULTISPECIES: glycosyltransferase family 4 protein [unclassified Thioclava]